MGCNNYDDSLLVVGSQQQQDSADAGLQKENITTNNDNNNKTIFPSIPSGDTTSTKVIFYHIYIPPEEPQSTNALRIVEEQLSQMSNKDVTLLYNTIGSAKKYGGLMRDIGANGNNLLPPAKKVEELCLRYNMTACHHLAHYESANEMVTLQNVYDYCRVVHNNPSSQKKRQQRVGYLHNKGSYHKNPKNEVWRYLMTRALVQDECWDTSTDSTSSSGSHGDANNDQCNACGLYFTHDQGLYFAGNVWTADCDYINRLIPPNQFNARQLDVYKDALYRYSLQQFQSMNWYTNNHAQPPPFTVGIARYSAEWWIGSHPLIRVCDYSKAIATHAPTNPIYRRKPPTEKFLKFLTDHSNNKKKQLTKEQLDQLISTKDHFTSVAPTLYCKGPELANAVAVVPEERQYFFALGGFLHRWIKLYQQLPPTNSWVWKSYPKGDWWKDQVQKYGLKVLDQAIPIPKRITQELK